MAAALYHRPRSRSRSRPPLEDEDLLSEILLRLPPQPSSLPRASAVCKRWRLIVSDRGFLRRYRRHHRRSPPLLGFFREDLPYIIYTPTMEAPDRVPAGRFSLDLNGSYCNILSCRHGLVLLDCPSPNQFLVWDTVTGDLHSLTAPLGFNVHTPAMDGAVLRAAGDAHHFQVVLVVLEWEQAVACIYSSETGVWSKLISTPVQLPRIISFGEMPAVLVADSLHWLLCGTSVILEVDLNRQSLALIQVPLSMLATGHYKNYRTVLRADGGLGLLWKKGFTTQLWKMNAGCDGVASWVPGRTIELDKLFSLNLEDIQMIAYAEENNVAFFRTVSSIFMVQLESLQFSKLPENNNCDILYPLESVYAAGGQIENSLGPMSDGPASSLDTLLQFDSMTTNTQFSVTLSNTNMDSEGEDEMVLDTANSRKRRRKSTPLDISEVRRSSRSTRFQGFKAPSMADSKRKQSYVKPRKVPGVPVSNSRALDTGGSSDVPPPTAITQLQS